MQNDETVDPIVAAMDVEREAKVVAEAIRNITKPSDVTEVIITLKRTQQVLSRVYGGLASWHRTVEFGVHHGGEHEPRDSHNPGWVRAEVALEEAAQYSSDAVAALDRARDANMSARWFDEIRDDA